MNAAQTSTHTATMPRTDATTISTSTSRADAVTARLDQLATLAQDLSGALLRYGLVAILLYIGAFKFTRVEADLIQPLVANSPFMRPLYALLSVQGVSNLIGAAEIIVALAIASRPFAPRLSALGSLLAVGMFVSTLSFLSSTPGFWMSVPGAPAVAGNWPLPVPKDGGFILKDVFLMAAALWTAAEAWRASRPTLRRQKTR